MSISQDARIYVAGHSGLVGSALVRALERRGCENLICLRSSQLDLRNQKAVESFYQDLRIDK